MYTFLGITLVLALLLTINATATMLAAGFGRLFRPLLRKCSARTCAEILFVMRLAIYFAVHGKKRVSTDYQGVRVPLGDPLCFAKSQLLR